MPEVVAIIGAGPLGRWLALAAARAGFRVQLEDVMPANLHHAQELLRQQLGPQPLAETPLALKGHGFSRAANAAISDSALAPEATLPVAFVSTIEEAVRNADLVIDCVPDELESKLEILLLLDRMAPPRTVLATPTTRHSIADLASCTYRPTKCVAIVAEANTLAENPEAGAAREILLRTTAQTALETVALLDRFWRQLGFIPRYEQDPAI
ncbi:MAG: 3-hydroxyacyl-CoA dehydrogenase NAD-binding domain-containing protein [Terracidiphilus sp.]